MENIILPSTIQFLDTDQLHVGKFIMEPCHQGYGTTLGNALRRVLLSSLPGAAVESIKINGVQHEFSAVDGIQEDVIEIILNIKHLAVRIYSDESIVLTLTKKGKGPVTAMDFDKNADVEIINPDLVIATITDDKKPFEMEVVVGKGRGCVTVVQKNTKNLDLGTIAIDSLYTPIRDVGYKVENTRVGDVTDYEKLIITIQTNGTISPKESIVNATKILMDYFALILDTSSTDVSADADQIISTVEEVTSEDIEEKPKKKVVKTKKATEKNNLL